MKRSRFSEEQIIDILKEHADGSPKQITHRLARRVDRSLI